MTLTVRAIASGSSGNAFLVETEEATLLLDAGLSAARLSDAVDTLSSRSGGLDGIVLTHEHTDHSTGALRLARDRQVPIYATAGTIKALERDSMAAELPLVVMTPTRPTAVDGMSITPYGVSHDAADPVGLLVEHDGFAVALATDLGVIDDRTCEWTGRADLLVIEANHDLQRLWHGPYPMHLKRRIASTTGHLSNEQAAGCILSAAQRGRTRWAWLAHLSDTNNTQKAATAVVESRLAGGDVTVEVVKRTKPSLVWRSSTAYRQARLF